MPRVKRRHKQVRTPQRRSRLLPLLIFGALAVAVTVQLLPNGTLRLSWARLLHATGNSEAALQAVEPLPAKNASVSLFRARVLFSLEQYDACRRILLDVGPETPADVRRLAHSLGRTGRWSEAIPALEISVKRGDDSVATWCLLADGYASLGEYDKAADCVEWLRNAGAWADALYRSGLLHREANEVEAFIADWQELLNCLESAREVALAEWQIRELLADACLAEGQVDTAADVIEPSRDTTDRQRILGEIAESRGDSDAAVRHWLQAIERDGRNAVARESLARALIARQQYQEAIDLLDPIELDENDYSPPLCQLYQFAYAGIGKDDIADRWQQRYERATKRAAQVDRLYRLIQAQGLPAERAVRAWKLASAGNRSEAAALVRSLEQQMPASAKGTPVAEFVRKLGQALRQQQELPDPLEYLAKDEAADGAHSETETEAGTDADTETERQTDAAADAETDSDTESGTESDTEADSGQEDAGVSGTLDSAADADSESRSSSSSGSGSGIENEAEGEDGAATASDTTHQREVLR